MRAVDLLSPPARAFLKTRPFGGIPPLPRPDLWLPRVRAQQARDRRAEVETVARAHLEPAVHGTCADVPVVTWTPREPAPGAGSLVYLHGGAYVLGSAYDVSGALLAATTGRRVVSLDYSLAPEAVYPVALEESIAVWSALRADQTGPLGLVGVSAGGNLALATVLELAARRVPLPDVLGLMTPCVDLRLVGDSHESNRRRDPVLASRRQIEMAVRLFLAGADPLDPLVSPVFADFGAVDGWPPTMITTGTRDLLLSDATRLYWRMRDGGAEVHLRVWEGMWHGFTSESEVPEGELGRRELGAFLVEGLQQAAT
ncbi:alpha/beta hydrolase [Nocardioides sp. R-C-SC26]|uniref:alpha/beta hydrolase n=1 Tax=Nocardioides sp. R-C-SC26 TaxID=2870414 RepID=UPI001E3219F7|nr:alpha/beta hydrolase [Nocardioides sp. R-C-SC26]